jgi:negative regulator of flagellin synthesis FlgM
MKVNQSGGNSTLATEAAGTKQSGRAAASHETKKLEQSGGKGVDKTGQIPAAKSEISSKSREMVQAKAVATHAPDVREDRIAELKSRIGAGAYQINEDRIADRLVDDHLRMPEVD